MNLETRLRSLWIGAAILLVMIAFVKDAATGADDPWANSPYRGWADKQDVMPAAKMRMSCDPLAFCSCCNQAEIVDTKFRPTSKLNQQGYREDGWEWLDPINNLWKEVPQDVIHWGHPTPDGRAVMFLWPPQRGEPRCFFPPGDTAQ